MANSVITNPSSVVKGAILKKTVSKVESNLNYIPSDINPNQYVIIAAYENSNNPIGAVISLGRIGNNVYAYAFSSSGSPYTSTLTVDFYYIQIT